MVVATDDFLPALEDLSLAGTCLALTMEGFLLAFEELSVATACLMDAFEDFLLPFEVFSLAFDDFLLELACFMFVLTFAVPLDRELLRRRCLS